MSGHFQVHRGITGFRATWQAERTEEKSADLPVYEEGVRRGEATAGSVAKNEMEV